MKRLLKNCKEVTLEMIDKAEETIKNIPISELPWVYNEINRCGWCAHLGRADEMRSISETEAVLLLDEIRRKVGFKAISRQSKMKEEGYSQQEFEDWWESEMVYEPLHKLYEFFGEGDGSYKSHSGNGYIENLKSFLFGILFAVLFFLLI